jgi:hypothetical protein
MPTYAESLEAEAALRREAAGVRNDLALEARLRHIGVPVLVGSVAMHVMVRRDIDVTTICSTLDAGTAVAITTLGATLARHPRVRQVQIRDDTGVWNVDPAYPDGWYLGLEYRSAAGAEWTLDLWFVDEPERQPDLAHLHQLAPRLTDEHRAAIVEIKRARLSRADLPPVPGIRVYEAVLGHDVTTPQQFDAWFIARA